MMKDKTLLLSEIRYAIRLTQRTARFYRRIQSVGTFLSIIGGSAAIASIANICLIGYRCLVAFCLLLLAQFL